jgi:glutamate 5-kinase
MIESRKTDESVDAGGWDDHLIKSLRAARRIVVKLGTNVVADSNGSVSLERVTPVIASIAALRRAGRQVVLVSSGAVGLGAGKLGINRSRLNDVVMRQACAAVGQSLLMRSYEQLFESEGLNVAQVLLTEGDFKDRRRYTNLQRSMDKLLKLGVIPIVNENDTVSVAELEYQEAPSSRVFGDNDRLAALVMSKLEADVLVLLTSIDGLCVNPGKPGMRRIPLVTEITPWIAGLATGPAAGGRGGMKTKLEAASIAMKAGGVAVIADGRAGDTITRIFAGEETGTAFVPRIRMRGKQRWIMYAAEIKGRIIVNEGARAAIAAGRASLLASGVVGIEEAFEPKDVVGIVDSEGREFARGIVNCTSTEANRLIDPGSSAPREDRSTGERSRTRVLVGRDNIVLLEK